MKNDLTPALTALRQAMQLEAEGYQFYTKAAQTAKDEKVKETFGILARDEDNHLNMVRRQYDSLTSAMKWVSFPEAKARPIDLSKPLFPKGKEALEKAAATKSGDLDALLFGLDIESKSYDLYRKAALETASAQGKTMYQFLAGEEQRHFEILMMRYEYLAG